MSIKQWGIPSPDTQVIRSAHEFTEDYNSHQNIREEVSPSAQRIHPVKRMTSRDDLHPQVVVKARHV
ncbi:hypothetical protein KIN20_027347 [Parelaphostrongylus tenuis]|uniref:Uncharacterized protein n=1 Tax=Parelaphostrongylus tenuis TaxID=148309 RepID=A0AAD5QZG9_PARTN|nr:hypothetical protein KIN20_027347 [Parelaphostrongylus tenuis]